MYTVFIRPLLECSDAVWDNVTAKSKNQPEPVFVKHYAPNICLPLNMAKFAVR